MARKMTRSLWSFFSDPATTVIAGSTNSLVAQSKFPMNSELICINPACRARYAITRVLYNCPNCEGLLEAEFVAPAASSAEMKKIWRERRMSNCPVDQSGVWRYREMLPFEESGLNIVTLRE